ncbi:MAG: hypothetical protein HEQ34_04060 [Sphingorhabdus sp.]|uniref:hypothetical protein n=1 Tax=Sphingorhabdus sp. TaxID=1902408 RepID=UPI0025FBA604|nr:hypothetical protein [Sphingorhabdus sp.]MCO4091113.1 hypothetical protein [Sphingorhabdus sp.]
MMACKNISPAIFDLGYKAVIVFLITGVISLALPLEAPVPTQSAAELWLNTKAGGYLFGWLNQVILMFACSVILLAAGLSIYSSAPLRAGAVWVFTLMATLAFLISKFLSLWSVPLTAKAIAAENAVAGSAQSILTTLGPSEAFGLLSSIDYLGFWLYGLIGLLLFRPLFRQSLSAKIAAVALLLYGILFHLVYVAVMIDLLGQSDVPGVVFLNTLLVLIAAIALLFRFRGSRVDTIQPASGSVAS